MCGIFFYYGKSTKAKNLKFKNNFVKYLRRRGPDGFKETKKKNLYAIHSRLAITGNLNQPIEDKKFLVLYNGEIYNDWKKYNKNYGDAKFLINFIHKFGYTKFKNLDGEYAIIIYDKSKNDLHLITDVFGTKPLAYAIFKKKVFGFY